MDIYKQYAAQMFNIPYEKVTLEQRRLAKQRFWPIHYSSNFTPDQITQLGEEHGRVSHGQDKRNN